MHRFLPFLLLGPLLIESAYAESVYKCAGEDGRVSYQREPCAEGGRGEAREIDPNRNVVQQVLPPPSDTPSPAATPEPPPVPAAPVRRRRY
jgi:hypothetical protein